MTIAIHKFRVEGISPLLMHNPVAMGGGADAAKKKAAVKRIPTPDEEAAASRYCEANGDLYMPSEAFRASALRGATGKKIGKRAATSVFMGAVFEADERTPIIHPETGKTLRDYEIFTKRVVVQRNGVLRSRARIWPWAAEFALEIDDDYITEDQVAALINDAGRMAGVGDWRPERKGRFGRYKLVENGSAK